MVAVGCGGYAWVAKEAGNTWTHCHTAVFVAMDGDGSDPSDLLSKHRRIQKVRMLPFRGKAGTQIMGLAHLS